MKKSIRTGNNKDSDKDNNKSNSYFAIMRRKRRKQLLKFGIPIVAAIIVFGVYIAISLCKLKKVE